MVTICASMVRSDSPVSLTSFTPLATSIEDLPMRSLISFAALAER